MSDERPDPSAPQPDIDPTETQEWLDAIEGVLQNDGPQRASALLDPVLTRARLAGAEPVSDGTTPYVNTIPVALQPDLPGDPAIERRLRSLIRWNALAMVVGTNKQPGDLGGHIASYQSAATLYEVGFNHFWHAPSDEHGGDLVYMQGHSSPGIYARAFLEGRISAERMANFRREIRGEGLSSYPHPWLMPDFWQFPTVSMGLGPLMAIQQARYMKYLQGRGHAETDGRMVWAFMGDGEMDEPESMGAISLAGRERLDNLVFVVNCNLQRLDGPVRGNGKIIQELESSFRGAGWDVVKAVWGSGWDRLLEQDHAGHLVRRMEEVVDGEYQTIKSKDGAYVREHFFGGGSDEEGRKARLAMVEDWTDEQIWALSRGGNDPAKVHAAYAAASRHTGRPTVVLAKTVKGYGMGSIGEGRNTTHQQKKMDEQALLTFRDRFDIPITDQQVKDLELYKPNDDDEVMEYLRERRERLGGSLPARRRTAESLKVPELSAFKQQLKGSGDREISTTMAFVRILATLIRDKELGRRVVPIVPDESRTFGMESMFRQLGIFSQVGQLYAAEDADQLLSYTETRDGQILQEGINEPGAISSWIAAATAYSNHATPTIPFYVFYSMFGFQRVGDLAWAAGDSRARGFLIGGTAGRTTLNGEGLQHGDGHSQVQASLIPNCKSYDPSYGYELAVIVQDGLRRMVAEQEDVFYYLTVENENYRHPEMPDGVEEDILAGLYRLREGVSKKRAKKDRHRVRLLSSGSILQEALAAAELLEADWGVAADVHCATSFTELRRDGLAAERTRRLHPGAAKKDRPISHVEAQLGEGATGAPVIAATDYVRTYADQIRPWVHDRYVALGTDGYGRSDTREELRRFFEIDRHSIVLAALTALADDGTIDAKIPGQAIERYEIRTDDDAPWTR